MLGTSESTLSYSSIDHWYPGPTFSLQLEKIKLLNNLRYYIDEVSELLYGYYSDTNHIMYANETANFYVQNNIVFRKPETEFSICPLQYIYNNAATIFGDIFPNIRTPYLSNQMITSTGKVIYFLSGYYKTNGYNSINTYGVNFCITNLTLQNDAINSSTKAVSINDKFTHTLADISNYCCATHGKYLLRQQNNTSMNNEMIIYNTDTDEYWLYPYKPIKSQIYGTNKIIMNPSSDNNRWTIYDLDTKEIVHQFDIPSDYAPTKFLAFEDWVYIYATYGSTHAMLLYTISTQEIKQIEYPSVIDNNAFCGFTKYKNTFNANTPSVSASSTNYFISNASMYNSCSIQYMDGILCLVSLDYHYGFIIISKYNPENIIYQSTLSELFSYSQTCGMEISNYAKYMRIIMLDSLLIHHIHTIIQLQKFFDIGRIIKNDKAFTSSDETEYQH